MIDLSEKQLKIINNILITNIPECEVWAFGSRVIGNARRNSDLDLVIRSNELLPLRLLENLRDDFSLSDLTIIVDVIDWNNIDEPFMDIIKQKYFVMQ